jgi:putative colanic acid biosynthesis acetyltransferase WcaB
MNFAQFIIQDWDANKGNIKGKVFMLLFRIANFCAIKSFYKYLGFIYIIIYKVVVQWLFTLEIPWNITLGKATAIYHGQALIMNKGVKIGDHCTIRHCTTIGTKQKADGSCSAAPIIGNHVNIGNNVCIIGDIKIGDHAVIGSGSVVVKDVAPYSIVAGNPAVVKGTTQAD